MSLSRIVSPLASKIRYDIENLFHHQYVHHPVYFRDTNLKPGGSLYADKERADEMLYFTKESARLLDNILRKWNAERDWIEYQEWLGLHKLRIIVRKWDLTKSEREALKTWGAAY
ncbi:hypothetical protein COCSUDRAFT_62950 [Coccomyxa subellipsoidea C-169]|uniref:Uncharacterized protein n=1 Tax=Coccomyxa subellipsoidea (strain C-169) TaxID=574566 RepID=I0YYE6_COCSC|nr:hypothetical protein COCSUDRAFT_62950 [Coccomyxa subellipsoidea C-169]EIE23415.1 hypothetical protein COCSUDRAFT_62950 [Coccomyxa subellipsoidea C-169]|eukprot:XP_005647959.1 hypothetical protein COCSUDRAFT_62950 [Coccomyxa subellipsoidea C-169]